MSNNHAPYPTIPIVLQDPRITEALVGIRGMQEIYEHLPKLEYNSEFETIAVTLAAICDRLQKHSDSLQELSAKSTELDNNITGLRNQISIQSYESSKVNLEMYHNHQSLVEDLRLNLFKYLWQSFKLFLNSWRSKNV